MNETSPRPGRAEPAGHATSFRPGDWVTHPQQPDWGIGQVQSVTGTRVTVTFEHAGKVLMNVAQVPLEPADR